MAQYQPDIFQEEGLWKRENEEWNPDGGGDDWLYDDIIKSHQHGLWQLLSCCRKCCWPFLGIMNISCSISQPEGWWFPGICSYKLCWLLFPVNSEGWRWILISSEVSDYLYRFLSSAPGCSLHFITPKPPLSCLQADCTTVQLYVL